MSSFSSLLIPYLFGLINTAAITTLVSKNQCSNCLSSTAIQYEKAIFKPSFPQLIVGPAKCSSYLRFSIWTYKDCAPSRNCNCKSAGENLVVGNFGEITMIRF